MKNLSIVGYTGFVGGYLASRRHADGLYNSKNFRSLSEDAHDTLICAGVSAVKWKANQEPEADMSSIAMLWDVLRRCSVKRFILISTVDVYPNPVGVDESLSLHMLPNHAYGKNRLAFEEMVMSNFPEVLILRLPALFGPGLKKNIIFDMMNARLLESIDPQSSFQWYGLDRLWGDIDTLLAQKHPKIVNLAVEPIRTAHIHQRFFPHLTIGSDVDPRKTSARYDMQTMYASFFGVEGRYIERAETVLERMGAWLSRENTR